MTGPDAPTRRELPRLDFDTVRPQGPSGDAYSAETVVKPASRALLDELSGSLAAPKVPMFEEAPEVEGASDSPDGDAEPSRSEPAALATEPASSAPPPAGTATAAPDLADVEPSADPAIEPERRREVVAVVIAAAAIAALVVVALSGR